MPNTELNYAVSQYKQRIESVLKTNLEQSQIAEPQLAAAMEYSLLLGGKRIRPFLIYVTGEMLGVSLQDLDPLACAMEAIHTYSLIHDDLPAMDDDDLRRGKATCHKQFDEATAILAGDTLQSFAFNTLSTHNYQQVTDTSVVKLIRELSLAANQMCAGQSIDLLQTGSEHLSDDKEQNLALLQNMHSLKTGALIRTSVHMAAIAGNASEQETEQLLKFANAIGLAFQVWDDVLDIISDSETLGKPQGSDVDANKLTYPALLGLQGAQQKAQQLVAEAVHALQQLPYNTALLQQLAQYIIERDH